MKVKKIYFILIVYILIGCGFIYNKNIKNNYYLVATDIIEDIGLTYKESQDTYVDIINAAVFAAGANENFIIAKQHPCKFGDTPNKKITNYFIIPLKNKLSEDPVENKIGPLSKIEFEHERKKLGKIGRASCRERV